tara:strand:+ start:126 stop:602 length:477 start_codon:yes stop_codon:yes gene_type:complete
MASMADPMGALEQYQNKLNQTGIDQSALNAGYLILHGPKGRGYTYEFVKIKGDEVQALAIFGVEDPYKGTPRFSIGYAVAERFRRQGLGMEVIRKGIEGLKEVVSQSHIHKFVVEAVVDEINVASVQLARKVFDGDGTRVIDTESGTPSLLFYTMVEV